MSVSEATQIEHHENILSLNSRKMKTQKLKFFLETPFNLDQDRILGKLYIFLLVTPKLNYQLSQITEK